MEIKSNQEEKKNQSKKVLSYKPSHTQQNEMVSKTMSESIEIRKQLYWNKGGALKKTQRIKYFNSLWRGTSRNGKFVLWLHSSNLEKRFGWRPTQHSAQQYSLQQAKRFYFYVPAAACDDSAILQPRYHPLANVLQDLQHKLRLNQAVQTRCCAIISQKEGLLWMLVG